jgi:hypothetical protein
MTTQEITIHKTDNLEETQSVNNLFNNASPIHSKTRRAGGRKKKEAKASELMASYLTTEQKEKVQAYCNKIGLPFSTLVRQLLAEKGIL